MGMVKKLTPLDVSKNIAEEVTGLQFKIREEAGKRVTLFTVDTDGEEHRAMYGTKAAAAQFLDGMSFMARMMDTSEKRREVYKSVQAEYDLEDILRAADMKDVKLSDEQAKRAVEYYDDHFSADVDEWTQRCDAIDAILAEDGLETVA